LEWKLQLAELYKNAGDYVKSERMYDSIIAKEPNHITALVNKALIRKRLGDRETAAALFSKAEQVAPNEQVKSQIRSLAQKNLESSP
jgi:tetratricopeptide (TPR) repeat protein